MPSVTEASEQEEDVEVFVDAEEDLPVPIEELKDSLADALSLKTSGNTAFKSSDYDGALTAYKSAMEALPAKVDEVTSNQADSERQQVNHEILELRKALWANMAAVYVKKSNDKEVVNACTEALTIDSHHIKSLHRRALANDRLSTWSSLTSAQTDYSLLLTLLPSTSPLRSSIRMALTTLPPRITTQQEKEKDEMIGKLKELGDGILGKFGLSTNMFKFDQQEGGGYNMRFER